jgi:hypothetical protein
MPREYTRILEQKELITRMLSEGKTQREVAQELGFKDKQVIKEFVKRERRKEARQQAGIHPKTRGRKAAVTLQEYQYENNRLKMENELLRDFLRIAGRR